MGVAQKHWDFTYGSDQMREMMKTYENGSLKETKYYVGNYEKRVKADGTYKEYTYISAPTGLAAVHIKENTDSSGIYYIHTDYLGSIMALTNTNGAVVEKYSYDACCVTPGSLQACAVNSAGGTNPVSTAKREGNRRNPLNWAQTDTRTNLILDRVPPECQWRRKHLDEAHIINMPVRRSLSEGGNGRMPARLSRSVGGLSPDPVLQNPYSTQPACRNASTGRNYNRYSYVVNNPLKYTDPTGYSMLHRILEEEIHGGNGLPSWYAGDDFFGGNSNNSNYHFYNNISHIANNQLGASGGWVYNFVSGEYDNALTGETMSRASMSYYLNSKAKRNDTGLDGRQVLYDAKNNTVTANLFDIYETAYSFGDVTNAGGSGFSMVEERFIQATGILGFSGPTIGLSIAKFPNGEFGVYWNNGNTTGVDLPNLDIGVTVHMSRNPNIDWETALQGWSSDWGGSYSFFGFTVGGNQYSGDFWSKFMKDYGSVSIMLNLGPNDLAGGANKNTTNQQHLFTLPMWFDIFW